LCMVEHNLSSFLLPTRSIQSFVVFLFFHWKRFEHKIFKMIKY